MKYLAVCFILIATTCSWAQVPDTEIYIIDIHVENNTYNFTSPINITNRIGYDNQPSFSPNDENILYTSIHQDEQADIYSYNIKDKTTTQLTSTPESEYSPIFIDNQNFSVVRVESDGTTQRLWQFSLTEKKPTLILENINPVGYYCHYHTDTYALFVVGEPHIFTIATSQNTKNIATNIGRCILRIPNTESISYVQKSDGGWLIQKLDSLQQISIITKTLPEVEDYIWTPDGKLWMGKDGKLYEFIPRKSSGWLEIADFSKIAVGNFNRMAINSKGNKLAVVSVR